jgi:DNA repair photolyase
MQLAFQEYRPRKLVNVRRHVDGPWFWTKYSAHPYVGCRSGCEFCYLRGGRYLGRRDPENFDTLIQVKVNAVELLRKELARLTPDVINCGDWQQPAEDRYRLSRAMLEVVRDLAFPLFIVERSALVTRDLDLLTAINQRAWVGVVFSLSNLDAQLKHAFEPRSPGLQRRLLAMAELARAGISVGATLMPIIPFAGDDREHLENVIVATKDHGGSFVLAGGLTMDGVTAQRSIVAAQKLNPELAQNFRRLYNWKENSAPNYSPPRAYSAKSGLLVRELCERHGLKDRMPRYIAPGPLAINKQIAEKLFFKTYDLELAQADTYRIWAYRKAAWAVDEYAESIVEIYRRNGEIGLQKIPGIDKSMAAEIGKWLSMNAIA